MSTEHEVVLVKLGGSLITDKRRPDTARTEVLRRLAGEVAAIREDGPWLLLGHGSGSFGHVAAEGAGLGAGPIERQQLPGIALTRARAAALNRLVIEALREAGESPVSLAPASFSVAVAGRPAEVFAEPIARALDLGLLPVVFGDVVLDRTWGVAICSTERVFLSLVEPLRHHGLVIRRAIWLGETDGVWDAAGETITEITADDMDELIREVEGAAGTDVTGGIRHRLETVRSMARLGIESRLGNGLVPNALRDALAGEAAAATRVRAAEADSEGPPGAGPDGSLAAR